MQEENLERKNQREVLGAFANYKRDVIMTAPQLYRDLKKETKYFQICQERKKQAMEYALTQNQLFLNQIIRHVGIFFQNDSQESQFTKKDLTQNQQIQIPLSQKKNIKPQYQNQSLKENNNEQIFLQKNNFDKNNDKYIKLMQTLKTYETDRNNFSKIQTTLKQFYREWCSDSIQRHDYIMIANVCVSYLKKSDRILVPGCGLGRLLIELVLKGFAVEGNEVTYFMLFGSNFILNHVNQSYTIYPFVRTCDYSYDDSNSAVIVPDIFVPMAVEGDCDLSIVAGEFTEVYAKKPLSFQGVATCFFIDTANNVFKYVDTIRNCLKEGGIWVNYGPLLFHYRQIFNEISIEVSWDILKNYISESFDLLEEKKVQTTYCHAPQNKMAVQYTCLLFVAKKKSLI